MKIGILVPVCSRNQTWTQYEDCPLHTLLMPSFEATKSEGYDYQFYIGLDDDDEFFLRHRDRLPGKAVAVSECKHAPARVWNILFRNAYEDGCEYMFQLADDVSIETRGWTERFIETLQSNRNLGVVGPCHPANYQLRMNAGMPFVLENAFVHRRHYEIFGTLYPHAIKNWFCDVWITDVYKGALSHMCMDHIVRNTIIDRRYHIEGIDVAAMVAEGRRKIQESIRGLFSFCLYGSYTDKYYRGLQENIELIRLHYPRWDVAVYCAPEAVEFVNSIPGVYCLPTGKTGPVNMTYRFLATVNTSHDIVCVRDTDSRIHARDRWCISNFIDSPYSLYTIRDHPYHQYRIMGGLWGAKPSVQVNPESVEAYCAAESSQYASDTRFLEQHIKTDSMVVYSYVPGGLFNDSHEHVRLIDCPLPNGDFCGNVVLFRDDGSSYTEFTQT
jgi:hypothetical protein